MASGYQPQAWGNAENVDTQMAYTGNPVDTSAEWNAAKAQAQTSIMNAIKQSNEQSGLTGTRWSTPLAYTNANIAGQTMENAAVNWTQQEAASQEAARQRQLTGASQLQSLGQQQAQLPMDAASLLNSLGSNTANYATGLASQLMSGGTTMANQTDTAANNVYQQFLKSLSENNPWLSQAMGLGSATGTPTTSNNSTLTSLLSGAGSLASLAALK
jgi:hypothetical protein